MEYYEDEDEDDYEFEDNPKEISKANWGRMLKWRKGFEGVREAVSGRWWVDLRSPTLSKTMETYMDPETGRRKVNPETGRPLTRWNGGYCLSGGPRLHFETPFFAPSKGAMKEFYSVPFFTWTTKMSCASFSVAAGPPVQSRGSCAASRQSAVERDGSYTAFHDPGEAFEGEVIDYLKTNIKRKPGEPLRIFNARRTATVGQNYLCDYCYAGKGRYIATNLPTMGQVLRQNWIARLLGRKKEGYILFVKQMIEAIKFLSTDSIWDTKAATQLVDPRFIRIHDAGDFWREDYYDAWVDIARYFNRESRKINFWAPTRQWVFQKWLRHFAENPPPSNLALRPSALFLGAKPPDIDILGDNKRRVFGGGSTSYPSTWIDPPPWMATVVNCPASLREDTASCMSSRNPDGEMGCRICWAERSSSEAHYRKKGVNYSTH